MPKEFDGLLDMKRRMTNVDGNAAAVKVVVEREVKKLREAMA